MKKLLHVMFCLVFTLYFKWAIAEDVKFYDKVPSVEEISHTLFPEESDANIPGAKTRSIKFTSKTEEGKGPSGIGMPIQFGFDSDNILTESFPYLDQVGAMLKMNKLADKKLLIEGHTDSSGSYQYNQKLSEQAGQFNKCPASRSENLSDFKI